MKRSKKIKLTIMGLSPLALTACSDKPVDMLVYKTLDECASDRYYSMDQCEIEFKKAVSERHKTSPKYKYLSDCESDFGRNRCVDRGAIYTPIPSAYMLPIPRSHQREENYYGGSGGISQPIYTSRDDYGHYRTGDNQKVGQSGQTGRISTSTSRTKSPSIKSTTVSRGGFGSQASARGSWGSGGRSFGG